jgi:tetratricopeptide (TPR) repeat protein
MNTDINPPRARGPKHFDSLLKVLKERRSHLYDRLQTVPVCIRVAVNVMRSRGQEIEAARLILEHWPLIEASSSVPLNLKAQFFSKMVLLLRSEVFPSERAYVDELVSLARRALAVALEACPGHETFTAEQDEEEILYGGHYCLSRSLEKAGGLTEALGHARRALELCSASSDDNRSGLDYNYAKEFDAIVLMKDILSSLGRVGEAEALLRTTLEKHKDKAGPPDAIQGIAMFRGELAQLLVRHGERYEEALAELVSMREALMTLTEQDKGLAYWNNVIPKLWSLAAECLWSLGRKKEALFWDQELKSWPTSVPAFCQIASELRLCSIRLVLPGASNDERKRLFYVLQIVVEHLKEVAERRATHFYFKPPDVDELFLQRLAFNFSELLLKANVPLTEEEVAMVQGYVRDLQGELEENRAIEEALREAVLEEVREEAMAARRLDEIETEMGKMTVKKKKNKKKKRGGRWGKKGGAASVGEATEGAGGDGKEEKAEEENDAGKEDDAVTDRDCSICFMEMSLYDEEEDEEDEQEKTLTLACGHRFHKACMDLWTNRCVSKGITPSCPMCRGTL